jgi:restriction endonuclease
MPVDDFPDDDQVIRILATALNVKKFRGLKSKAEPMVKEIKNVYGRSMNKIVFDYLQTQDGSHREMFSQVMRNEEEDSEPPQKKPKHLVLQHRGVEKNM